VFEPGAASALLCSSAGIERLSLADGALTAVSPEACDAIRVFGEHAVVHATGDPHAHVVDLANGQVLLEFDGSARPPPAGSPFFHHCLGSDRVVTDVARATSTTIPGTCARTAVSEDGRYWIAEQSFELITLGRPDGAELDVHVIWVGDTAHAYAEADDHAFWVASADDTSLLNVVARTGDALVVTSGADPEMQRRFYRPTLLADFIEGRPLPVVSP
jgi:hypothetical protein